MTSGKFGFERDVVEKATVENIPIPTFEKLDATDLKEVESIFDAVTGKDSEENWNRVDAWAAHLYGLRESDLQVIEDTLSFSLPFAANRMAAQARPDGNQLTSFREALAAHLAAWANKGERMLEVLLHPLPSTSPWQLVRVQTSENSMTSRAVASDWTVVLNAANELAATEVLYRDEQADCLWVARLAQARYWSRSQARLVARRIIWEHSDFLLGVGKV